jgi:hypothetical protein
MIKGKKTFLFAFAGVVALLVAVIFTFSKGMRENFMLTVNLLLPKNSALPIGSSQNRNNEVNSQIPIINSQQGGTGTTSNPPPQKNDNAPANTSIYWNDEFGFQFSVPDGWQVEEKPYTSPYSYFNLILIPLGKKASYLDAVVVNIVKPEFVEMSYHTLKPSDIPIVVDGVKGVKYEYAFEGGGNLDYILPRTQNTFIIGSQKEYNYIFNEVVSSFKFLKMENPISPTTLSPQKTNI